MTCNKNYKTPSVHFCRNWEVFVGLENLAFLLHKGKMKHHQWGDGFSQLKCDEVNIIIWLDQKLHWFSIISLKYTVKRTTLHLISKEIFLPTFLPLGKLLYSKKLMRLKIGESHSCLLGSLQATFSHEIITNKSLLRKEDGGKPSLPFFSWQNFFRKTKFIRVLGDFTFLLLWAVTNHNHMLPMISCYLDTLTSFYCCQCNYFLHKEIVKLAPLRY